MSKKSKRYGKYRKKKGKGSLKSGMERKIMSHDDYYKMMIFVHFGQQESIDDPDEFVRCENCYDFKNEMCSGRGLVGISAIDLCINELTRDRRGELQSMINQETGKRADMLFHASIDDNTHVHIWGNDYEGIENWKIIAEKECGMRSHTDLNSGPWKDAPVC